MPSRQKPKIQKKVVGDASDPRGMVALAEHFLEYMRVMNYSLATVEGRRRNIGFFAQWCEQRGITRPTEVTRPILERYRRYLYHYRKPDGQPMTFRSQCNRLVPLRAYFKWLCRNNYILYNPASELELPKIEKRLPRNVLTIEEAERTINSTNVETPTGIRDRAILETFYSTGLRRSELMNLGIYDIDLGQRTVFVKEGKGMKDRIVPIGERAAAWVEKYLNEVRPRFVFEPDNGKLFITDEGDPFTQTHLTRVVRNYFDLAGITKKGSCHIWRHTCATLMVEGGCDIKFVQQLLGHGTLNSTSLYTQVSIKKLQEMHHATHPARMERTIDSAENTASD